MSASHWAEMKAGPCEEEERSTMTPLKPGQRLLWRGSDSQGEEGGQKPQSEESEAKGREAHRLGPDNVACPGITCRGRGGDEC